MDEAQRRVMTQFAQAIIEGNTTAAHRLLAPWLQRAVTPDELAAVFERGRIADAPAPARIFDLGLSSAVDYATLTEASGPHASLASYAHGDELDPEIGMEGPPCFALDPALDDDNFRGWGVLDLGPPDGDECGLDFVLRLSIALAEVDGKLCIGHVEPELT
ncbi:MAG: hypothetical protein JO257_09065 [Deltaproteobacteria bacterium]|nr:hypothetical protein [Deltaproteobacteria bacterium]